MAPTPPSSTTAPKTPARYLCHHASLGMLLRISLLTTVLFSNMVLPQHVVEYLPGFPGKLPFKLETGYIGVGENEEVQLFYYFVESDSDPDYDPLILWLTGGPGCSGISGLMYEIGPLKLDINNSQGSIPSLILNEHSWTKRANIIFIDQPVGTGFSYAKTSEASYSNDTLSAIHTHDFLRKWLVNHPKYLKNPLYVGGDSYSGISVPLTVKEVFNGVEAGTKPMMNIKGYVLGNAYTDSFIDINGRVPYAHRLGLLSDELYQSAKVHCHGNYLDVDSQNVLCLNDLERINECVEELCSAQILSPTCASEDNFLQLTPKKRVCCQRVRDDPICNRWGNNKSTQKALYIREGTIGEWIRCNESIQNSQVGPSGNVAYINDIQSTIPYHQDFTNKRCRALIYSGDHDMIIPHTTTKNWIDSLKLPIQSEWRPWFVEGQVAGYTITYADNDYELTFATIKGGGHTAPDHNPVECFAMVDRWFGGSSL